MGANLSRISVEFERILRRKVGPMWRGGLRLGRADLLADLRPDLRDILAKFDAEFGARGRNWRRHIATKLPTRSAAD